ncbi:MAG: FtsQ-type POTRA domain-containing protein [Actinomycetes bacterium]
MSTALDSGSTTAQRTAATPPPDPKRFRLMRLRKRTYIVTGVLLAVVVALAVWLFYFSSVFALETLVIEGVKDVSPAQVGSAAQLQTGIPLAKVDTGAVEAQVEALPSVANAQVTRRWPHTIVITIVERHRVATVASGDQFLIVDSTGYTFNQSKKRPAGLPLLEVADDNPARGSAIEVLTAMPDDILALVDKVAADSADKVVLTLRSGVTVVWGGPADSALKADVLRALLDKTKDKWIDLRTPNTPTSAQVSPKPAPPPVTETPSPSASATPDVSTGPTSAGSTVAISPGPVQVPTGMPSMTALPPGYLPAG